MVQLDPSQNAIPSEVVERFGGAQASAQPNSLPEVRASEGGRKPINYILQDVDNIVRTKLKPRRYQEELFEQALKQNVIIYLGTGLGKTFITVLLLNSPQFASQIRSGRKVVFLAPTQDLVKQQAEYIFTKCPYKNRVYCGRTCQLGIHIDKWTKETWQNELREIDILFMTPHIFSSAVMHNLFDWTDFSLVILDEVHHACKKSIESKHAYGRALKHLKELRLPDMSLKPRVIGLTASLVNNMPKNTSDIESGINGLERLMNACCITDIKVNETKPQMVVHNYNKSTIDKSNDMLVQILMTYSQEMDEALNTAKTKKALYTLFNHQTAEDKQALAYFNKLKLASKGFSIKPSSFPKVMRQLAAIRSTCGLWTTAHICCMLIAALDRHAKNSCLREDMKPIYHHFAAMLRIILMATNDLTGDDINSMLLEYTQPKLMTLLDLLKHEYHSIQTGSSDKSTFSCIVFVKSRIEVVAICNWLKMVAHHIPEYNFLKVDYAIGLAATAASKWSCVTSRKSTEQGRMLDNFREGNLNVIITTSVLEEGIDLPVCSTVVRYDESPTFRVYVQSRGRARQVRSSYIAMCESEKALETEQNINKFNDFEEKVKQVLSDKDRIPANQREPRPRIERPIEDKADIFILNGGKIVIDGPQAKLLLHMYCQRLTQRHPFMEGLVGETYDNDGLFSTKLYLPVGCPINQCEGLPKTSVKLSEESAYIEAIKRLHEVKELDDNAVPRRASYEHLKEILSEKNLEPDFSPLSAEFEGQPEKFGDKEVSSFDWNIFDICGRLSRNCTERRYKLFKVKFSGQPGHVREDTKSLFLKQTFCLIVDASYTNESWPTTLFGHYGDFNVDYQLLKDDMIINNNNSHYTYVNYTYHLITKLLGYRIRKAEFERRCIFYLLPMGDDERIRIERMRTDRLLTRGDIVTLRANYRGPHLQFFLVKAVRLDMNPMSEIPGRRGLTFRDLVISEYGQNEIRDYKQPVIEVIPISRAIAKTSPGKRIEASYQSTSCFYLDQFFDLVEYPPEIVFQLFNMPEIIYNIYLSATAFDLEQKFVDATSDKRKVVKLRPISTNQPTGQEDEHDLRPDEEDEPSIASDGEDNINDGSYSEDDTDSHSSDDTDLDDGHSSEIDSDGEAPSRKRLHEIWSKKFMKLDDSKNKMEKWNLDEYNVTDLKKLTIEHRSSYKHQNYPGSSAFSSLGTETRPHQQIILTKLAEIQRNILSDDIFEGEDHLMIPRDLKVDLTIEPSLSFENNSSFINGCRHSALIEALTQRRANSNNNLESLENIGDSYLKYVVSVLLFKKLDQQGEGILTAARSNLTSNKHFTHLAKKNKLGSFAITNRFDPKILEGALGGTAPFRNILRPKDLADMFESIIGSSLIYGGEFEANLAMQWLGLDVFDADLFQEFHETGVRFSPQPTALLNAACPHQQQLYRQSKSKFRALERILNYNFNDPSYLIQALTHGSAVGKCTGTYERLEFLGDAILDFLVTMTLYTSGVRTPGQLSASRSALVNNFTFARLTLKYRLHVFIEHASQMLYDELNKVDEHLREDPEMEFIKLVDFDNVSKLLGDIFESIAAAIYLDSGCSLDAVWKIYYPIMKSLIDAEVANPTKNLIARLHEIFPGSKRIRFDFVDVMVEGECHKAVTCTIDDKLEHIGHGASKHQAKLRAVEGFWLNPPSEAIINQMNSDYAASRKGHSRGSDRPRGGKRGRRGGRAGGGGGDFRGRNHARIGHGRYASNTHRR